MFPADLLNLSSRNYHHSCWLDGLKITWSSSYLFRTYPFCGYQTKYKSPALDSRLLPILWFLITYAPDASFVSSPRPSRLEDCLFLGSRQNLYDMPFTSDYQRLQKAVHECALFSETTTPPFQEELFLCDLLILAEPMTDRSSLSYESKFMRTI